MTRVDPSLEFDAEQHAYTLAGRKVPSVTQILRAVCPDNHFAVGDWYLQRGSAVHKAIELWVAGQLDESSLDERIAGRVASIQKFIRSMGLNPVEIECRLASRKLQVAGTIDLVGELADSTLMGFDWKGSYSPAALVQLAFYHLLWKENGNHPWCGAVVLECHDNGTHKATVLNQKELEMAERTALAMLTVYNFLTTNKMIKETNDNN